MKKLLVVLLLFLLCACRGQEANNDYFYEINQLIKEKDFLTANVEKGRILLYDGGEAPIEIIPFDAFDDSVTLRYIRKEENRLFFVVSAAVDDENGVVFMNDAAGNALEGIQSLERIGGNAYYYDTAK